MNQRHDLASAVRQRERGRDRIRLLTVTAGVASLATAGVVAVNLPGSSHTSASNGSSATPATTQPSAGTGQSGDDGGSDDGGAFTVPGSTANQAPAHAISGGS